MCVRGCLRVDESSVKAGDVSHIPQTAASHVAPPNSYSKAPPHGADMLRSDPRDSFHKSKKLSFHSQSNCKTFIHFTVYWKLYLTIFKYSFCKKNTWLHIDWWLANEPYRCPNYGVTWQNV